MCEEEALIRGFIVPARRRRLVELLANPKSRAKVTRLLAHFRDLDPRWVVTIPPSQHGVDSLWSELRQRGAGDSCYVVSEDRRLDAKRLPLRAALTQVVGAQIGALISCVPGVLAYFEDESGDDRCILHRSTRDNP